MIYTRKIDSLAKPNVHIKDPDRVNNIIKSLVLQGFSNLQVVSDFDRTITKQHENGKQHLSSFCLFEKCPSVTEECKTLCRNLKNKYYPIELDHSVPLDEKKKYMEEWWSLSENALNGLKVSQKEIEEVCLEIGPTIRDGTKEVFDLLSEKNVPVLVFSAGLGDVVQAVLKEVDVLKSNVKIISNFLKYVEDGTICGYQDSAINIFNKNEYAIKNSDFYDMVKCRTNVIVLGDSLGDALMADGIDHVENILKIGFLYPMSKEALPAYMDTFDIVLEDDQTMHVLNSILDCISKGRVS